MNNWTKYTYGGTIINVGGAIVTASVLFMSGTLIMSYLGYSGVSITKQVLQSREVHETAKDTVLSLTDKLISDPKLKQQTKISIEIF